jgi:hypothetical protein
LSLNLGADPIYPDAASADSAGCSSVHVTIAPVPSSVLASVSAWNSSFSSFLVTAIPSGGSGPSPAFTGQGGSTSKLALSTKSATQSASSAYTSTFTLVGGALPTSTNPGGLESTAAATTTKAGSNTGGAEGWRTMSSVAVVLSILCFGVSVLCVL